VSADINRRAVAFDAGVANGAPIDLKNLPARELRNPLQELHGELWFNRVAGLYGLCLRPVWKDDGIQLVADMDDVCFLLHHTHRGADVHFMR